jgi:hypothetical protein
VQVLAAGSAWVEWSILGGEGWDQIRQSAEIGPLMRIHSHP